MTYDAGRGQSANTITLETIARALALRPPVTIPLEGRRHAAVALLLRLGSAGPEVLFIERARHDGDPWSGDFGFPGGKVEPSDAGPRQAAEREVLEEIGVPLEQSLFLGRLDDISGAHLPVIISCFVWSVAADTPLTLGDEAVRAFWIPLGALLDPRRRGESTVYFRGAPLLRPAIRLLDSGPTVLWGITYRLVCQFLGRLGHPLPSGEFPGEVSEIF